MQKYKLHCEILSPIHIGAGHNMDPLSYIIKGNKLYSISLERFILAMGDVQRKEFEAMIDKGDLIKIRKYIAKNVNTEKDAIYSAEVSLPIASLYTSKIETVENQLLIYPFIERMLKLVEIR